MVTVAPGITPWASRTVPEMLPRVSWALAGTASSDDRRIQQHVRMSCSFGGTDF
jgi:hypothetical protein